MPIPSRLPRVLALTAAISTWGAAHTSSAAISTAQAQGLSHVGGQSLLLAECDRMRNQLIDLDETIERLPEVRAVRDAFAQSPLGLREETASRAFYAENCMADEASDLSDTCVALMAEIDACAEAFEHSADFKRVQALPEVVAFEQLSQRYADFCPEAPPALPMSEDDCDLGCEEEDPCEGGTQDDDAALPMTV